MRRNPWPLKLRNTASEESLAFGVGQLTDAEKRDGEAVLTFGKPAGDSGRIVILGPTPTPAGAWGTGTRDGAPYVLYDTSGPTPQHGDEWGPVAGSWRIGPSGSGLTILGDAENGRVRVAFSSPPEVLGGVLAASTVAGQVWANVTPRTGFVSIGQVRVRLASNAEARPAGDRVEAVRMPDPQQLTNPGGSAVTVAWEERTLGEGSNDPHAIVRVADGLDSSTTAPTVGALVVALGGAIVVEGTTAFLNPGFAARGNEGVLIVPDANPTGWIAVQVFRQPFPGPFVGTLDEDLASGDAMVVVPDYDLDEEILERLPAGPNLTVANVFAATGSAGDKVLFWPDFDQDSGEDYVGIVAGGKALLQCTFVNDLFTDSQGSTTTVRPKDATDSSLDFDAVVLTNDQHGRQGWSCTVGYDSTRAEWVLLEHDRYHELISGPTLPGNATMSLGGAVTSNEHAPQTPIGIDDPTNLAQDLKTGDTVIAAFSRFTSLSGPQYTVAHCDDGKTKVSKADDRQFLKDQFAPISDQAPNPAQHRQVSFVTTPQGSDPTTIEAYSPFPEAGACLSYTGNRLDLDLTFTGNVVVSGCNVHVPGSSSITINPSTLGGGTSCLVFAAVPGGFEYTLSADCVLTNASDAAATALVCRSDLGIRLTLSGTKLTVELLCDGDVKASDDVDVTGTCA